MIKKISLFAIILLCVHSFAQQTKEQLQKQSAELKKQIAAINSDLSKSRSESRLSLAYLSNVTKKIELREKVYNNTQKEKRFIEDDIYLRQLEINRQTKELEVLRKNYAEVLISAYKNRGLQNKVTFILSSGSIGEAIRRIQYLKLYSDYQERKAAEIGNAAKTLQLSIGERQKSMKQKDVLLSNQEKELTTINAERIQKEKLLEDFRKNETKLVAQLNQRIAQQKAIDKKISSIIAEEYRIAKAEEEAKKKAEAEKIRLAKEAAAKEKAKIDAENKAKAAALEKERLRAEAEAKKAAEALAKREAEERKRADEAAKAEATARDEAKKLSAAKEAEAARIKSREAEEKLAAARAAEADLVRKKDAEKKAVDTKALATYGVTASASSNFSANKGKMSMPVYGPITHHFGRQKHPVYDVWEDNLGIKIAASKGSVAKCVFPGEVTRIMDNSDGTLSIFIKHGTYFTVYSNLKSISVKKGQQVAAGTTVGVIGESFDGSTTLDFQVWNGQTPVNPQEWVN